MSSPLTLGGSGGAGEDGGGGGGLEAQPVGRLWSSMAMASLLPTLSRPPPPPPPPPPPGPPEEGGATAEEAGWLKLKAREVKEKEEVKEEEEMERSFFTGPFCM